MYKLDSGPVRRLSITLLNSRPHSPRWQPNINVIHAEHRTILRPNVDEKYEDIFNPQPGDQDYQEKRLRQAHVRANIQGRHTHAEYWPNQKGGKWIHHTTPLIPNYTPLPGREQDVQIRAVSECTHIVAPWYTRM